MFTVEEVADELSVSKVTIYAKLKKFDDRVILKQGKKYITEELLSLIRQDLKVKKVENNILNNDDTKNQVDSEIASDREDLIKLNKELIKSLIEQLDSKDRQLEEKDNQISELHKLIENSQVLLRQEKQSNQLQLEDHLKEVDLKLNDVKGKLNKRKEQEKKGVFSRIFSRE